MTVVMHGTLRGMDMSSNNLRGITLNMRPALGMNTLVLHASYLVTNLVPRPHSDRGKTGFDIAY